MLTMTGHLSPPTRQPSGRRLAPTRQDVGAPRPDYVPERSPRVATDHTRVHDGPPSSPQPYMVGCPTPAVRLQQPSHDYPKTP